MTVAHDLILRPQALPLSGSIPVPSDARIAELVLLCTALAEGDSEIRWLSQTREVETMAQALRSLGVRLDADERRVRVSGVGLDGLAPAAGPIARGASSWVIAELAGVLVARPFITTIAGGDEEGGVDLAQLASVLRGRGAQIEGRFSARGRITLPLVVGPLPPRMHLSEVDRELLGFQPEIKSALLVSGLFADGPTYLHERVLSPDHAARLLEALGVPIATAGSAVELDPAKWSGKLSGDSYDVPGDFSAAMIFLAAASLVDGSRVCARDVGLNPLRTGGIDVLRSMGVEVHVEVHAVAHGEPRGTVSATFAHLRSTKLASEMLARAQADVAALMTLAARARGTTEIAFDLFGVDREPLDRFGEVLLRFGIEAQRTVEGMVIEGCPEGALRAAEIDATDSADIGVAAILLGLLGDGETKIRGVDALAGRFPRLVGTLRALGADVRIEQRAV